ncbi:hypothetical protein ACKFKG_27400 [Phormidesmis sp. 146-35]
MNKRIEKWLTVCALGSWAASIGALVAIEASSSQPLWRIGLSSSQLSEPPSQTDSVLNRTYQSSEQTILRLSSHPNHWLDRDLSERENSDLQPSSLPMKTTQVKTSISAERVPR